MIRKDLQLFFSDRRSVIVSFVVPIAIASFFGSIFNGPRTGEPAKIAVMVIDQDETAISKAIVAGASCRSQPESHRHRLPTRRATRCVAARPRWR